MSESNFPVTHYYHKFIRNGKLRYTSPHFIAFAHVADEWQLDQAIERAVKRFKILYPDVLQNAVWCTHAFYAPKHNKNLQKKPSSGTIHMGWVYLWTNNLLLANLLLGRTMQGQIIKKSEMDNEKVSDNNNYPANEFILLTEDLELCEGQKRRALKLKHVNLTKYFNAGDAWVNDPFAQKPGTITRHLRGQFPINCPRDVNIYEDIYYYIYYDFVMFNFETDHNFQLFVEWTNNKITVDIIYDDAAKALFAMQFHQHYYLDESTLPKIYIKFQYVR